MPTGDNTNIINGGQLPTFTVTAKGNQPTTQTKGTFWNAFFGNASGILGGVAQIVSASKQNQLNTANNPNYIDDLRNYYQNGGNQQASLFTTKNIVTVGLVGAGIYLLTQLGKQGK